MKPDNSTAGRSTFANPAQKNTAIISTGNALAEWANNVVTKGFYPIDYLTNFQEKLLPSLSAQEIYILQTILIEEVCFRAKKGGCDE